MKCILFGGSGEVGGAVARALIKSDLCSQLSMLGRRAVPAMQGETKVEQMVVDTTAADFEEVVKEKAQGHDVAISCIGIGSGTMSMSEEQIMEVEVHMVGKYARGCKAASNGKELWQDRYTAQAVTGAAARHPGPRSSPVVVDGKVVTLGVGGILSCLDATTGKVIWRKDEFSGVVPQKIKALCLSAFMAIAKRLYIS